MHYYCPYAGECSPECYGYENTLYCNNPNSTLCIDGNTCGNTCPDIDLEGKITYSYSINYIIGK